MKRIVSGIVMLLVVFSSYAQLEQKYGKKALTKESVKEAASEVKALWMEDMREKYAEAWKKLNFKKDTFNLFCAARNFGAVPADGRCLFISMHGGGRVPKEVNNQQWMNQIYLYEPAEGVYIAPRAPWDDSDMWHKKGLDELFEDLIRACVVFENVNPDKGGSCDRDGESQHRDRIGKEEGC